MNSPSFGNNMFNNLSSVKLPSTAKSIGYYTFAESSLLYFDLPPSITSIGQDCFLEQKVTMDYKIENNKSVVKLPKDMTISKFNVSTQDVVVDSVNYELIIPNSVKQIDYSYKLGTFGGVECFLTGTLTLGNGLVKVRFLDYDDSVLEEVDAVLNGTVVPSKTPTRDGYTFIGWDKSLENITGSLDIKAQYKRLPEMIVNDLHISVGDTFDPLKNVSAIDADGNEIKDIKVIKNTVDTLKEGTYQVTLEAKDQWGGKVSKQYNVIVNSKFFDKILEDKDTGVSIKGSFTANAKVIVELTPVPTPSLNNKIKDKSLINAFEVHVVGGEFRGKLVIRFPLDEKLNDTSIYVYHEKKDGTIEEFKRTVKEGIVEIEVDELSPFVLAKDKTQSPVIKPNIPTKPVVKPDIPSDNVQTGDRTVVLIPMVLLIMTGLTIITLKKKYKKI